MTADHDNHHDHEKHKEKVPDDVEVPIPPDGGYGWVVLIAAFFISFIIDGCMYSFGILLVDIRDYFGVTQDQANLIISLNTGFLFLSGPAVAGFANKFSIRAVIMVGSVMASALFVTSIFSPNIYFMMISFGLFGGIFMGCTYLPSVWMVSLYFSTKRGIATGITMAGSGVGAFVFAPFTKFLLQQFDWKMTNVILAAIVIQCCILGALMRPLKAKKHKKKSAIEMDSYNKNNQSFNLKEVTSSAMSLKKAGINEEDFERPMYKKDILYTGSVQNLAEFKKSKNVEEFTRSNISIPAEDEPNCAQRNPVLKVFIDIVKEMSDFKLLGENKQFLLIVIANFFVFAGYFLPYIYIPIRADELGISNYAILFSIIGIVNIPARILFGIIADRKIMTAFNLNTLCFIICCIANFSFFLLNTFWLQVGYAVAFAIGIAGLNSLTTVYLCDMVGLDKLTNANGIISMFRGFGCFVGPYMGGLVSKHGGTVAGFHFSGVMFLIGVFLVLLLTLINLFKRLCNKEPKAEKSYRADDTEADKNLLNRA